MWVEKRLNGKYKYCERYKDPVTGKDRKVSITLTSNSNIAKNKAVQELNKIIQKKSKEKRPLKSATFGDVVQQFIEIKEKEVKPSSIFAYRDRLRQVVKEIGDVPMERLTPALINNLFLDMIKKLSYSTVSNRFRLTKNVIEFAVKYGYLVEDNITHNMTLPKINKKSRGANDYKYLEPHQWEILFEDGEYIFIKKTHEFKNGQFGVFIINGESYLKKVYQEKTALRLVSLNPDYNDLYFNENDNIKPIGRVVL